MNWSLSITKMSMLTPEIVLAGTAFIVLLLDILRSRILFMSEFTVERRQECLGKVTLAGLAATLLFYYLSLRGGTPVFSFGNGAFVANHLNTFFKMVIIILAIVTVVMGLNTPFTSHVGEYYSLIIFSTLGMVFLTSSEDLLMIFVALELISLALYALTAIQKGVRRSVEGGLKYFIFGGLSSAFLIFGLSYIFGATGQTSLSGIASTLQGGAIIPQKLLIIGILFSLVGLGFKIAAVPFHLWAPDAYEGAPTPIAALIATGSKVASFVALTKLLLFALVTCAGQILVWPWSSGWTPIIVVMAVLSMVVGNFAAIGQRNVKRLLAYSSIAHAGYILVAAVAINQAGVPATIAIPAIYFYVFIYALTNIGAFGVVNAIASKVGGDDFEHFTGMARRAPFLSLLMLIFILSLAGIPPLAGFFGKFYLFAAAVQADPKNLGLLWLVAFAILMSAVSLYYYLKLAKQIYVLKPENPKAIESCPTLCATLGLVCIAVVWLGIFPSRYIEAFKKHQPVYSAKIAAAKPLPPPIEVAKSPSR